jgi:predicted nuclease of restriction endonuclease-like (RecB) superfamily
MELKSINALITRQEAKSKNKKNKNKNKTMKITSSIKSKSVASRHENLLFLSISDSDRGEEISKKNSLESSVSELKETISKK